MRTQTTNRCLVEDLEDVGRTGEPANDRVNDERTPRAWAEQAFPNLIYFNQVDEGNHFTAWQEPDIFTTEVRAGFRSLRDERSSS